MKAAIPNVSSLLKRVWSRQIAMRSPSLAQADFTFFEVEELIDGDLKLVLAQRRHATHNWCPQYNFHMRRVGDDVLMGNITLRVGDTDFLTHFAGQIGYGVDEAFRGQRLAARSVRLLLPLARRHGINPLWITCNPDNWASRKTCEIAGGTLVEIVDLPTDCEMYRSGERQKCRYKFEL